MNKVFDSLLDEALSKRQLAAIFAKGRSVTWDRDHRAHQTSGGTLVRGVDPDQLRKPNSVIRHILAGAARKAKGKDNPDGSTSYDDKKIRFMLPKVYMKGLNKK